MTTKPVFTKEVYIGCMIKSTGITLGRSTEKFGWLALSITSKQLAQYSGHNIEIKIQVVKDLGEDKNGNR